MAESYYPSDPTQTNSLSATPDMEMVAPPVNDMMAPEKLLAVFEKCKKESFASRWVWEREWLRDLYYVTNRHWIYWHPSRREWVDKRLQKNVPRPVTNKMAEVVQSLRATFGSITLGVITQPIGHNTESVATAEVVDKLAPLIHEEHKMNQVMREGDFWLLTNGSVCIQTSWDTDIRFNRIFIAFEQCMACGTTLPPAEIVNNNEMCPACGGTQFQKASNPDGTPLGEWSGYGKGKTVALSPFEYALPPNVTRFDETPYIIRMRWRDKHYYEANHPDIVHKIVWEKTPKDRSVQIFKSLAFINDLGAGNSWGTMGGSGGEDIEGVTEYELWVKPTLKYPEGLIMRVIGESSPMLITKPDESIPGPLPYKDRDGAPLFPFAFAIFEHIGGRLYGRSVLAPLIQKQDQLNQLDSLIQMIIQRTANPVWIVPEGSGIDQFTGDPGLVLKYNPLAAGGAGKPERIGGENVQPALFRLREQYLKDIEELAGCLHGDTVIPCLDGVVRTMKELSTEFPNGGMWVYGFDCETMRVVPSYVEKAWSTGIKKMVRVSFEEGTYIECTPDHPFLTYDRGYVRADELRIEEPVVPLLLRDAPSKSGRVYQSVTQPVDRTNEPVHRMVAYAVHGLERGQSHLDVHHIDCNGSNNLPENLEVLTRAEHLRREPRPFPVTTFEQCSAAGKKRWQGKSAAERASELGPMHSGRDNYWDSLSVDERRARNTAIWQSVPEPVRLEHGRSLVATRRSLSMAERIAKGKKQSLAMKTYWETKTPEERQIARQWLTNHRVAAIEAIGDAEVFDLTTSTQNFGTNAGVFVHNTYDIIKGQKPAGVEAFSALQLLVERSQARFTSAFASRGEMYRAWFTTALELERAYGPQERILTVVTPNKGYTFKAFQKAQLQGNVSIKVEDGTDAPKTSLGKRAAIEHANQLALLKPDDPEQRYALLNELGLGHLAPSLNVHVQTSLQMQDAFERWLQNPQGPSPLIMKPWFDAQVHYGERIKWLNSDHMRELMAQQSAVEQLVMIHLQELQTALLPPPQMGPDGKPLPPEGVGGGRAMQNSNTNSGGPAGNPATNPSPQPAAF